MPCVAPNLEFHPCVVDQPALQCFHAVVESNIFGDGGVVPGLRHRLYGRFWLIGDHARPYALFDKLTLRRLGLKPRHPAEQHGR